MQYCYALDFINTDNHHYILKMHVPKRMKPDTVDSDAEYVMKNCIMGRIPKAWERS